MNISCIGIVRDSSLSELLEKGEPEDDFEFKDRFVIEFEDANLKFDEYNTSPGGLYSIQRAEEEIDEHLN